MSIGRAQRLDSVGRALQIIETVADLGIGTTGKEVAERLGLPAATTYRLLNTLVAEEYLVRTADLKGFALGSRLADMVSAAVTPTVPARALSLIEEFRASVRFGVHILYFRPTTLRVLDPDPDHPLVGERDLMRYPHASAAGKVLLASHSRWRDIVGAAPPAVTSSTIVDVQRLAEVVAEVRVFDVATDIEELAVGVASIAVPILDINGEVRGAVAVSGVAKRIDAIISLTDAARGLASALGPLIF